MHLSSRRGATLTATVLATLASTATVLPASADAATYVVQQCHQSTGYAVSGMVGTFQGNQAFVNSSCASGARNLGASFGAVEHAPNDRSQVTFTAPAGTSLDSLTAVRDASAGTARNGGAPIAQMYSSPGGQREEYAAVAGYTSANVGSMYMGLDGDSSVSWGVVCVGSAGCPASNSHYLLSDLAIRLRDLSVPTITNVAGSLRTESNRTRNRSLTYATSDSGGGVFRQRLIIDGSARSPETVDSNAGTCAQPFSRPVPCKTQTTGTVSLDTATLSDGAHELSLDVRDATDENKALHGPWTIVVDNAPPVVGSPTITGTAREGDTLTCAAAVAGQSPSTTFQWFSAANDGSGATAISGATNAAYTQQAADIGRKLICRVTGTDGGGSASKDSTITQAPFDGGRTVASYCTDRPTGPTDDCGDLDGDQIPNRNDDDLDGDGTLNVNDVAPYDATRPAADAPSAPNPTPSPTSSGTPSPNGVASGGGGSASQQGQPSPGPAAPSAATLGAAGTVKFLLGRETATFIGKRSRWSKSAFTIRGRLTAVGGEPISGLKLFISQTVRGRSVALGSTVSTADGSWAYRIPRGPGRTITIAAGDGLNAATMTIQQQVRAHVAFRAINKRVRSGGLVRFTGQLRGGHTNTREKLVEFQVYYRKSWRTIGTLRVNRSGKFSVRYRFGTAAYGRYKFRARTMPTDGYPFTVGTSSTRAATVRVS